MYKSHFINCIRHFQIPLLSRLQKRRETGSARSSLFLAVPLAVLLSHGSVVYADLLDGLQLHVGFENNVLDSSANGFDGEANGDLQYVKGVIGQAAVFDGVDDQVLFPAFSDALIGDNDFTLTYWFSLTGGLTHAVLSKRAWCGYAPFFDIRVNAASVTRLELSDGNRTFGVSIPETTSEWHHVAFTRSGVNLRAFLNAKLVDESTVPENTNFQNTSYLGVSNSPCIGADGTQMLEGRLDDLRIYNRPLSEAEIRKLIVIFSDGFENIE